MEKKQKKSPLYLLTGLLIGLAIGLFVGWFVLPTKFFDITPASLHDDFKADYLLLAAQAWDADRDIGRAYSRIREMSDPVDYNELEILQEKLMAGPDTRERADIAMKLILAMKSYR